MELAKAYDPKQAEENHYKRWEENGFFSPEINQDPAAPKYSIVIPPPNVTGSLHMGHALQHTLMDVLTRWKRMQGYRTLFLVGVDHAGISTQLMVTRQLKKDEHKTPQDIGREAFTAKVWQWKDKYGGEITRQIRREGLSVDWSRERFTMEEDLSRAVREVFVRLFEEGWIYRGTRIVNWCPRDKTVLSDLEVKEAKPKDGKLYYLRYPVSEPPAVAGGLSGVGDRLDETSGGGSSAGVQPPATAGGSDFIVVATTRPETMLGDTAVAVNPGDERYANLIGSSIALPLTSRTIPIIADAYVDPEFGTGAVKITPAHDPNDWEIGERHSLEKLVVMNDDATMNAAAGMDFAGLDRYAARELVVERFENLGLLEKIEDYDSTLPACERCGTVIEPLLSEQWFVKMDEMRDMALALMRDEGLPRFFPEVPHKKVYTTWLENLRDWTISRQLWWGHQIPAWYDAAGNVYVARTAEEAYEQAGTQELTRDEDVLDTWFSSALWPFSTLGWMSEPPAAAGGLTPPDDSGESDADIQPPATAGGSDLATFYPTDVLVTGRDIIFLWVSRMVMTGLKFTGQKPFDDVIIHGTVLDRNGQRMSKTKANGIDPLDVFEKFGVDATRLTLAGSATGIDFAWRDEKVESYRNFANKIWNATRFCLMNAEGAAVDHSSLMEPDLPLADRWIISRLNRTALDLNKALGKYEFHTAVSLLYHFFWDDFCDWYIELTKDEISAGNASVDERVLDPGENASVGERALDQGGTLVNTRVSARRRILTVLEVALRMLHPFMPHLTEELWLKLPGVSSSLHHRAYASTGPTIMLTSFPPGDVSAIDEQAEREMTAVIELIKKVRNIRTELNIPFSHRVEVLIETDITNHYIFKQSSLQIARLVRAGRITIDSEILAPKASARSVTELAKVSVPLEGLIDFDKERERLSNQISKLTQEKARLEAQLSNTDFVDRAPAEKVLGLRERSVELESQITTLESNLASLA